MASRIALALFSIPLVCRMHPASAVDSDALAEPVTLPTVVVTPTRLPTPESEIGSSITVIPSEEIERKQERTLPDALQYVPVLNVVQTGGPGGTTSVFIRGANANQTKVFIDGIDATDPATGTFNFEHIRARAAKRALRRRRDRRGRQHHHKAGVGPGAIRRQHRRRILWDLQSEWQR
ncbi:MAG: TonB-dependent receptor [Acetobacteraceae bacterium]|nr:TonB-dependent receptor [Acetobacteraceae bacterium]